MVAATFVPRLRVLVGGLEPACRSCRAPLLIREVGYCGDCLPVLKRRALVALTVASLGVDPNGAA